MRDDRGAGERARREGKETGQGEGHRIEEGEEAGQEKEQKVKEDKGMAGNKRKGYELNRNWRHGKDKTRATKTVHKDGE